MRIQSLVKAVGMSLALLASSAFAGTLTVTSPNDGDFLGKTNTLSFQLRQSNAESEVSAILTQTSNPSNVIKITQRFTPNIDNEVSGSMNLNFSDSTVEGDYSLRVEVKEPGNTYSAVTRSVKIDVKNPEFLDLGPINNSFVRGIVPIRVRLDEPNIKQWRVQVNGQDISNNSGSTNIFTVNWDTSGIQKDGVQNISINVEDLAHNTTNKSVTTTLDRVKPSAVVLAPSANIQIRRNQSVPVAININDQFAGSVSVAGVDVVLRSNDGKFLRRVARISATSQGSTLAWTGIIQWSALLPKSFKMVVTAMDRAGNVAVTQEVPIKLGN